MFAAEQKLADIEKAITNAHTELVLARFDLEKAKKKESHFKKVCDFVRTINVPEDHILDKQEMTLLTLNLLHGLDEPWGDIVEERHEKEFHVYAMEGRLAELRVLLAKTQGERV